MISPSINQKNGKVFTISRLMRGIAKLTGVMVFSSVLVQSAHAQLVQYDVKVANAPAGANDIELLIAGTGNSITGPYTAISPAAQNFAGSGGNMIIANWVPLTMLGDTYEAYFWADPGELGVSGGDWTFNGNSIKTILPADGTITLVGVQTIPEPSAMALLGSSCIAGVIALRKRFC
jgi:hypothetical protein